MTANSDTVLHESLAGAKGTFTALAAFPRWFWATIWRGLAAIVRPLATLVLFVGEAASMAYVAPCIPRKPRRD